MHMVKLIKRGQAVLGDLPLGFKATGVAVGLVSALALVMAWQIDHAYYRLERQELLEQARFVANVVAAAAAPMVSSGKEAEIQALLGKMAKVAPATGTTVERLEVRTGDGKVIARSGGAPAPSGSSRPVFEESVPLPGTASGVVTATLSDGHIGFELGWHKRRILWTTCIVALLGLALGGWLMRLVTRPVTELVGVTRSVKAGDYQARAPVHAHDEIGELGVAFNDMMDALQQKETINRQLTRKLITAEEELRKCLAHELQNQTGQALASLIAGLAAIESGSDTRCLPEMRSLAAKTLSELHDIALNLRPSALEDLGLVSALQKFCRNISERFGVQVDCSAVGLDRTKRLAAEVELALYRIGQEALTNAVRHGRARCIEVLLQRKETSILAVIEDDGAGFDASQWRRQCVRNDCLGLLGIEERAALLGGKFRVESRPGGGTSLFVEIPVPEIACA